MALRFILGKAHSGKTSAVIREIQTLADHEKGKALMIVPEQYSHEAERELCAALGDRTSLYAEVMSFTGFARWGESQFGGGADFRMDGGGKLLCMAAALKELQPFLHIYGRAADNPELQAMMVKEATRFRTAASDSTSLRRLAGTLDGELGEKLKEMALILEAYDAALERAGASPEEPLSVLERQIRQFGLHEFSHVYVDGFIDFTGLELKVLRALLTIGTELTVCLSMAEKMRGEEYFLPSKIDMDELRKLAEEMGREVTETWVEQRREESALTRFADHMFDYAAERVKAETDEIRILSSATPRAECEAAAAEILHAVREEGCRWRDIAVAVRGYEDYRGTLEGSFQRYGIPVFAARRDGLAEKPFPMWLEATYDILLSHWEAEDVTAWLRCGLSGLHMEECDELCSYLYKWQLRAKAWECPDDWGQHPEGYGKPWTEESREKLARINRARRKVAGPLLNLRDRSAQAKTAHAQVQALLLFLQETDAARMLEERVRRLEENGMLELRAEYVQLWELCINALEQIDAVLGEREMDTEAFRSMLRGVLSCYDIGMIPVALDRVAVGDFDRMRRRNIKRLIVLGCSDDRLPQAKNNEGVFNEEERDALWQHDLKVGGGDAELWREYALIYHTLTLPHEKLILSYAETGLKGEALQPAMVYHQAERMFGLKREQTVTAYARLFAPQPALALAMSAGRPGSGAEARAAATWFQSTDASRMQTLRQAANRKRERLSPSAVEALYGRRLHISPSRLESFASCRYAYYCNYGLKAEQEQIATFHAPEIGTFVHAILERTAREVSARGGFPNVEDDQLRVITRSAMEEYIRDELGNYREKTARFRYLFERICEDVYRIVADSAAELRKSDFAPLSFELDVSRLPGNQEIGDETLKLTGIADRVDGWLNGDTLMLRVVDYKTGRKKFSLSDVWYGRNMQMLLYLATLCDHAEELYGRKAEPAGIEYLPAREELLHFDSLPDDEKAEKERLKGKRRSGLVLDDPALIEAWEKGEDKHYIPVRLRTSDPLVSLEQMGILRKHVEKCLKEMSDEIFAGSIDVNPSYVSESDNACRNCPYHSICHFEEGENGEHRLPMPKLDDETVWGMLREET